MISMIYQPEKHLVEAAGVVGELGTGRERVGMGVPDAEEEVRSRPVVLAVDHVADPTDGHSEGNGDSDCVEV